MKLPITKPYFNEREYTLIQKPLDTGWVVQGPFVQQFEKNIAEFTGAKHTIAVNSCTSGQFIMSRIVGLESGDEVIVPSFTWVSTVNSIEFLNAKAIFCDIDLKTFTIDINLIENLITENTKAIYPVTLFGMPAKIPNILKIAEKYRLKIVEDCACGLGAFINGRHCGTYDLGGILSFHPRKSITTGEGGMILTNNDQVAEMACSLRDHGAIKTDFERSNERGSFLLAEYPYLGYNMRMTDIQGAIGVAQSEKINWIVSTKQELAKEYNKRLEKISWLKTPEVPDNYQHGYQTYCTLFKPDETIDAIKSKNLEKIFELNQQRNEIMAYLEEKGIMTRQGTHAVHIQQLYRKKYNFNPMDFPNSFAADKLTIAIPFYPTITEDEKDYLFNTINQIKI